jgi:putative endonuclease
MGWLAQTRLNLLERTLNAMHRTTRRLGGSLGPMHLATGIEGEDAAFFYLRRQGYTVVARRWSSSHQRGDLDLIAWHGEMLCFIEVKTRTAHDIAPAEANVDSNKRHTLRKLARVYLRQLPGNELPPCRFDILSVYLVPGEPKELMHFEAAFGWRVGEENEWR